MSEKIGIITQDNVEVLKRTVISFLQKALAGYEPDFKSESGHVEWGKVQKEITKEMDSFWVLAETRQRSI